MNQGDRLKYILEKKEISVSELARRLDITRAVIYQYYKTDNFQSETLEKILSAIEVSREEFFDSSLNYPQNPELREVNDAIPFYDVSATMSYAENWPDNSIKPAGYITIPGFEGCVALQAFGHSMYPTFENGCWILCREIFDKDVIMYGECYVILTSNHLMIKRIQKSKKENYLQLNSDNYKAHDGDRSRYEPVDLPLEKVLKLWFIRGCIKKLEI